MSAVYNIFIEAEMNGSIDLLTDDLRAILVMSSTTVDTENDGIAFLADFTTLDEFDGANNERKVLAGRAVVLDDGIDGAKFDFDDITWTALGAGARQIQSMLLYKHVTNDTDSVPIAFLDFDSLKTADSSNFTAIIPADALSQVRAP